jgi:hypothetical protein
MKHHEHTDEHGRHRPARSRVAREMRGEPARKIGPVKEMLAGHSPGTSFKGFKRGLKELGHDIKHQGFRKVLKSGFVRDPKNPGSGMPPVMSVGMGGLGRALAARHVVKKTAELRDRKESRAQWLAIPSERRKELLHSLGKPAHEAKNGREAAFWKRRDKLMDKGDWAKVDMADNRRMARIKRKSEKPSAKLNREQPSDLGYFMGRFPKKRKPTVRQQYLQTGKWPESMSHRQRVAHTRQLVRDDKIRREG